VISRKVRRAFLTKEEAMSEEIMNGTETGEFLGVPAGTLANWRYKGVRYRRSDVLAWLEQNAREPEQQAATASR
jgi:hypothetical protein